MAETKFALARLPPLSGGKIASISPRATNRFDVFGGPSYRLENKDYPLPLPKALKPYVDTKAGELDTWPAHASGQALAATSAMLSKNKSLVMLSEDESGKPKMIPKPRFLEQLENFLKKELRALGVTEVLPSELRLQAHREVFEYLIEDFKTYRHLLAAIKNEYEMMLASQRQQIRELEPLRQMLVTVSEQCDQKVMALREEEKQEIIELKAHNTGLQMQISSMRNKQKDLEEQVVRLQDKLQEEYRKYRDEFDARKLLVSDINDLRYQQEDYLVSKQSLQDAQEAQEDPVTLKIALRKAREDEKSATQRLNEMVANYGDVIPRRDFEALEAKHKKLEEESAVSKDDFRKLQVEHEALLDVQKQVTQQRDEFYLELETLKRSSTPRPDWDRCADHINGGLARWKEMAEGKRSNELVDVLLTEIGSGGLVDSAGADFFDSKGSGADIPAYLRSDGQVRNRRLGKRDCSLLIKDIWREKGAHDAQKTDGKRENMAEFLHMYLQRRFSLDTMVMEWGYNLHDALQRYANDDNIGLFWGVLTGEVDEEVYHKQLLLIQKLITALTKMDSEQGNQGQLSREDFRAGLQEFFSGIEEEAVLAMVHAAEVELDAKESPDLEYKNLFMEDDEGRTGPFLDSVKKWLKDERKVYVEDIKVKLEDTDPVSPDDLKRALSLADPEITSQQMDSYLAWAFRVPPETVYDCNPLEQATILQRLENGNVFRVGQKM
ncbi:translin-associated factor X-interacting protein 1-like [Haliotis rufescens]|uniref:translin-associated factor X-interacting protein 1-like n=1 Tax=Haliotis rufescens TaxID=6454 RepID=UPI00201F4F8C|nr:translin-associated factor X-interacting protein 1-like [Haliotis rufescens]